MEGRARGKSGGDAVTSREVWGKVQDAGRFKQVEADDSSETQAVHDTKRDEPSKTKISSVTIEGVYLRNEAEQVANPGPSWDVRDGDAVVDRSPQYEQSESVRSVSPFAESSFPLSFQGHDDGDVNGESFVAPTPRRVGSTVGGTADELGQHSFNAPAPQWKDPTQGREEAGSFSVHQNLQSENDHSTWLKSAAELALAASGNDPDARGTVEGGLSFQTQGQSPSMSAPVEQSLNAVGVTSTFSPMPNVFAPAHTYRSGSPIAGENAPNPFSGLGTFPLEPEAAGQSGWGSRFATVQSPGKFGGTPEPLPGRHSPRLPVHPGLTPETMFGFGGSERQPEVQQMFPLSPPLSTAAPPDVNNGVDPRRVSVTNIAPETDMEALRKMLESFGPLMDLLFYHVYNGITAVAAYRDHRNAQLAIRYLDGQIFCGRELSAQREPADDGTTPVMHDSFALNSQNYVQNGLGNGNEIMPQMMSYDAAPVAGKNRRNSGSYGYGKMRYNFQDPAEAERRLRMLNLSGAGDPGRVGFKSGPSGSGPVISPPDSPGRSVTESAHSISEPSNFGRASKSQSKFPGSSSSNSNNSQHNQNSVPPKFQLNIAKVLNGDETRTTLMIRNIPNKYNQKMMLQTLEMHHRGVFDFFYLPIDFKNKCNVGYAFINFRSPKHIVPFFKEFHGRKWGKFNSEKVCEVAFARLQNKAILIGHFQNSSLMNEDPKCRPIIFGENGEQEEFPVGPHVRTKRGPSARESRPDGSP